jgi:predicted nucleotide-binding protein
MEYTDPARLARKRNNLMRLRDLLVEQESALTKSWERPENWEGASESQMGALRELFDETKNALPEKNIQFGDSNDFEGLQAQMISVRSKIAEAIGYIESRLGTPASIPTTSSAPSPQHDSSDRRRVFVVHGRNENIRHAMFSFLRAIGLDPIEWEEAIAMTKEGAPYTGQAIDAAFSKAHAAVILITGDDIACLKQEFILEHDDDTERKPTPQARPNVLFELGLAFGRKPDRTIVVEFGKTRPISDSIGRNVIRFSDTPDFRQKLAGRLRNAGCLLNTDSKSDWLSTKFDFSSITPKLTNDVRFSHAFDTTLEAKGSEGKKDPSPLLPNGSHEFIATSEDRFFIRITRLENKQIKGLILGIENRRLDVIAPYRIRIMSARSFDYDHQKYRHNDNFKAFVTTTTSPTQPACRGDNTWLVRKVFDRPHLQAGNSSGYEMEWPNADNSPLQCWLLKIDVSTKTIARPGENPVQLQPIELDLPLVWIPEENEFFIEQPPPVAW